MIDFNKHKNCKLQDVATLERVKKNKEYPSGCTLIQVSATKGEVDYHSGGVAESGKYVAVVPDCNVNPLYLFYQIQNEIRGYISKVQQGLNIPAEELNHMPIMLHDKETQNYIAEQIRLIDERMQEEKDKIKGAKQLKRKLLEDMFVS